MALAGLVQDVNLEPHPHPVTDLMHFLKYMMDCVRPVGHAALDKMKGLSFWISLQVRYNHPAREVKDMKPQYLHTSKRRLINHEELEEKLDAMLGTILLHNAHFVRQSSRLVLPDVLTFRFKASEFLPLVGREYKQLPTFLAKKKAIVKFRNTDNKCFGYAITSALVSALGEVEDHVDRAANYLHLFGKYGLDPLNYPFEVANITAIEDKLGIGINVYSFFDDEGKWRYPLYTTQKAFERTVDLLYWDEHYAWIKNFRRFMADLSCHHTLHWRCSCLRHFGGEEVLKAHKLYCRGVDTTGQVLLLPDENRNVKFENEPYANPHLNLFLTLQRKSSLINLNILLLYYWCICDL